MKIMKSRFKILTIILLASTLFACKEDEPELGNAPSAADAGFTFTESPSSPNILQFKASNSQVIAKWDFGNGSEAQGINATGIYPNKGKYTVTLTIFAKGGKASTSQEIDIANSDASLLANPLYTLLTGGVDSVNGKTWVIDSANGAHFGVGPNPVGAGGLFPEWYAATANEKAGAGFYNDRYRFFIDGFKYDMVTKGDIYVNTEHRDFFPGASQTAVGDYMAPFQSKIGVNWSIEETATDTIITVSGGSFIGYYTGVNSYKVIKFTENELFLRQLDSKNSGLAWYLRLIPAGTVRTPGGGGGGGNPTGVSLPIDFETNAPDFESFGGSTDTIIDNPDKRGINFSDKVLETVHGNETWAGISVDMGSKFNFNTDSVIALKIWTMNFGDSLVVKLEDQANSNAFVERKVPIPVAFTWVEVQVTFGAADSDLYDKLVLFPGWNRTNPAVYQIDDIIQK